MDDYAEYWVATLLRGGVGIFAGLAVLVLPEMVTLVSLVPFAILISMMCLAMYMTVDSTIVLVTSFLLPDHRSERLALRLQGVLGAVCGISLFFLVYDGAQLRWFLYLAALQAACIAISEFIVAKGTSVRHGSSWCYASALIAAIASVALLLGRGLDPHDLVWLLFFYLGIFGFGLANSAWLAPCNISFPSPLRDSAGFPPASRLTSRLSTA